MSNRIESLTIVEDAKEGEVEDEEGLTIHPYESLTTTSSSPASDIDVTKREVSITIHSNIFYQRRVLTCRI